jgi:hypothetical protein
MYLVFHCMQIVSVSLKPTRNYSFNMASVRNSNHEFSFDDFLPHALSPLPPTFPSCRIDQLLPSCGTKALENTLPWFLSFFPVLQESISGYTPIRDEPEGIRINQSAHGGEAILKYMRRQQP